MKKIGVLVLSFIIIFSSVLFLGISSGCSKSEKSRNNVYDMVLIYDEENYTIGGDLDFTFYNNYDTSFKSLKFNLFPNAYRQEAKYKAIAEAYLSRAYYNGMSYGNIKINSVKQNSKEVEYKITGSDCNILEVVLAKEIFPGEKVNIVISFTTQIANVIHRLGVNKYTVNLSDFYPVLCAYDNGFYECVYYSIGDPFYTDVADYNVTLTINQKFQVASSGELISLKENGTKNIMKYMLKNCRDFAFCISEKYQVLSSEIKDIKVNYYYYDEDITTAEKYLETTKKSIETFIQLFGNYPYKTYSVVKTEFLQGGMEYSGIVYISDILSEKEYEEVIVHETAHQWWYGAVGNNQIESAFLDEGLAEYSVVLFYEKRPEYEYTRAMCMDIALNSYKSFCTVYDMLFKKVDTSMLRPLSEYSSEFEYVNINYMKSAIMFDELRKAVGEKKFFNGLKKYYEDYYMKNAKPYDLVGVYEKIGAGTNGFFEGYLKGTVLL